MPPLIALRGQRELVRAFTAAGKSTRKEVRAALASVAEPIRHDAESLAVSEIPRIGTPWSRMRIGVTTRVVYVAPRQRGVKGRGQSSRRRPNLAPLLLDRAMEPALDHNAGRVEESLNAALGRLANEWERI